MSAEERKTLEEAGQEKIEFTLENTTAEDQSTNKNVADDKVQVEFTSKQHYDVVPIGKIEQEPFVEMREKQIVELPAELKENIVESGDAVNAEEENGKLSTARGIVIQDEGQDISKEEKPQTQKRWKVWKEKIQGFIKKLFA
jgi:hypothetical protein